MDAIESEFVTREEWERYKRFRSEQVKTLLLQLEDIKRRIDVLSPKQQLAPPVRDLLDKQVEKAFQKLAFVEREIINLKKGGK